MPTMAHAISLPKQTADITNIPLEILDCIWGFLNAEDLYVTNVVCRFFRRQTQRYYRHFQAALYSIGKVDPVLAVIMDLQCLVRYPLPVHGQLEIARVFAHSGRIHLLGANGLANFTDYHISPFNEVKHSATKVSFIGRGMIAITYRFHEICDIFDLQSHGIYHRMRLQPGQILGTRRHADSCNIMQVAFSPPLGDFPSHGGKLGETCIALLCRCVRMSDLVELVAIFEVHIYGLENSPLILQLDSAPLGNEIPKGLTIQVQPWRISGLIAWENQRDNITRLEPFRLDSWEFLLENGPGVRNIVSPAKSSDIHQIEGRIERVEIDVGHDILVYPYGCLTTPKGFKAAFLSNALVYVRPLGYRFMDLGQPFWTINLSQGPAQFDNGAQNGHSVTVYLALAIPDFGHRIVLVAGYQDNNNNNPATVFDRSYGRTPNDLIVGVALLNMPGGHPGASLLPNMDHSLRQRVMSAYAVGGRLARVAISKGRTVYIWSFDPLDLTDTRIDLINADWTTLEAAQLAEWRSCVNILAVELSHDDHVTGLKWAGTHVLYVVLKWGTIRQWRFGENGPVSQRNSCILEAPPL